MGSSSPAKQNTRTKSRSNTSTKQQTGPWKPTQDPLKAGISAAANIPGATSTEITPAQDWAISGLQSNAENAANQFNPQQQQLVSDLFAGGGLGAGQDAVNSTFEQSQQALSPYLNSNFLDPNSNPYLQPALANLFDQTYNSAADKFALAGRGGEGGMHGDFGRSLGEGYSKAAIPALLGQFNTNAGLQQNAASMLPGLANNRASTLDAGTLNQLNARSGAYSQIAPMNSPYTQSLTASDIRAGLPYTNLNAQAAYLTPLAQLGSKGKGSSSTNSTGVTNATMYPSQPSPWQTAAGIGSGALGLIGSTGGFGPAGWLSNAFG